MDQACIVTAFQTAMRRWLLAPLRGCALFTCLAFLSACAQKQTAFDCAALDDLLVTQVEAITVAQKQLDRGNPLQEIQQGLGAVVAKGEFVADQCYEANYVDAGQNCIRLGTFGRTQDLGGLLRALHGADLTEGPTARVFAGRMLSAARDAASEPASGPKCMHGT